ncbi:MAG: hypothetical protein Q3X00_01470 [Oscillospiraceae bacterium]|nr:hypothetical protein [Oscillospiraceae bacterium]
MSVSDFMLALPSILFWVGLFVVLRVTRKKREEASRRPKNAAQRKLVDDVIATIERTAPDFDGADVYPSGVVKSSDGSYGGCVIFESLRGDKFEYDFGAHGYVVSEGTAMTLASEIAKHFGGEYRPIREHGSGIVGYGAISPRQLAKEREQKRREDSLKRL